jgi:hypothetical protein
VARSGNLLAGVLVGLPDIDEDRALVEEALGGNGIDAGKRHGNLVA